MTRAIAISLGLIVASGGAGLALSAVHGMAFAPESVETREVRAATPEAARPGKFIIPEYVPRVDTGSNAMIAPAEVTTTALAPTAQETPRPQPRAGSAMELLLAAPLPREDVPVPRSAGLSSTAPIIVTHMSTQNAGTAMVINASNPALATQYAHGVYR
ncbi:MAG: hypothetical protein AAFP13_15555 [Pseudomonadota bacterium]